MVQWIREGRTVSQKDNIELPWDNSSTPGYISSRELKTYENVYRDVHGSTTHNSQKVKTIQVSRWIYKMWFTHKMEYYYLENIMLSERPRIGWLHVYETFRAGQFKETESRFVFACRGLGRGGNRKWLLMGTDLLFGVSGISSVGYTTL